MSKRLRRILFQSYRWPKEIPCHSSEKNSGRKHTNLGKSKSKKASRILAYSGVEWTFWFVDYFLYSRPSSRRIRKIRNLQMSMSQRRCEDKASNRYVGAVKDPTHPKPLRGESPFIGMKFRYPCVNNWTSSNKWNIRVLRTGPPDLFYPNYAQSEMKEYEITMR